MKPYIEIFPDAARQWHWVLCDSTGRPVFASLNYPTKADCLSDVVDFKNDMRHGLLQLHDKNTKHIPSLSLYYCEAHGTRNSYGLSLITDSYDELMEVRDIILSGAPNAEIREVTT
jgi:uncharacterized protein YegP (UPF0339 family)